MIQYHDKLSNVLGLVNFITKQRYFILSYQNIIPCFWHKMQSIKRTECIVKERGVSSKACVKQEILIMLCHQTLTTMQYPWKVICTWPMWINFSTGNNLSWLKFLWRQRARKSFGIRKLRIWSHLLKKSLMENFIFCAVRCEDQVLGSQKNQTLFTCKIL